MGFQARQYDPQLGRFLGVDPLADKQGQQVWSPYSAMSNAPESIVDPMGKNTYHTLRFIAEMVKHGDRAAAKIKNW